MDESALNHLYTMGMGMRKSNFSHPTFLIRSTNDILSLAFLFKSSETRLSKSKTRQNSFSQDLLNLKIEIFH